MLKQCLNHLKPYPTHVIQILQVFGGWTHDNTRLHPSRALSPGTEAHEEKGAASQELHVCRLKPDDGWNSTLPFHVGCPYKGSGKSPPWAEWMPVEPSNYQEKYLQTSVHERLVTDWRGVHCLCTQTYAVPLWEFNDDDLGIATQTEDQMNCQTATWLPSLPPTSVHSCASCAALQRHNHLKIYKFAQRGTCRVQIPPNSPNNMFRDPTSAPVSAWTILGLPMTVFLKGTAWLLLTRLFNHT